MRKKQKTDYSMLIIMLPFCLMFELAKIVFQIIAAISAAATKPNNNKRIKYISEYKPKAEQKPIKADKQKPIDYSKIEKCQSEIRKSKMLIEHYNDLLECQINLYREELYKDKPKENRLITLNNQITATKCKIETEHSKIKQNRIKLKQIRE